MAALDRPGAAMTAERPARRFPLALGRIVAGSAKEPSPTAIAKRAPATGIIRPQRPVAAAHADASRGGPAVGLGLDSADVRARMVERLRRDGVAHSRVLTAFAAVPRHVFVDAALATQAYEDTSLPIGHGQTISKPSVVARMIELLFGGANAQVAGDLGAVLEIGTGCGYQAALLCRTGRRVISVERLKPLHDKARELLAPMRATRLRLVYGDGMLGHAPGAPYDSIVAAAGGSEIPQAWLDQLAVGGRLVSPVQHPEGRGQVLVVIDRTGDGYDRSVHEAVKFVPLKSGLAR
jgi:protein-L-isoaspartate(D-aspartate) O-methyltransferase